MLVLVQKAMPQRRYCHDQLSTSKHSGCRPISLQEMRYAPSSENYRYACMPDANTRDSSCSACGRTYQRPLRAYCSNR